MHHMHLFHIEKLKGHHDVEAHANANSRYKVRIEPHDGHGDGKYYYDDEGNEIEIETLT